MTKQMIINASASEEIRVAILENVNGRSRLLDLDIENQARTKHKGNIYKGIVANVEDSLEAAFIEFGDEKQAFLALSEVRPALYPPELKGQRRPKISDVLKRGQEIVVQVTKDEIGNKGAAVTTYLSLPGRYLVLMHSDEAGGGVSRKVEDEGARRRAREILNHIEVPDGMAVIIRTAGVTRSRVDLYRDLRGLAKQWETIDRGAQLGRAPTLLYREPDLTVRTIRDYLAPDIEKIVIDVEDEYEELKSWFEERSPEALGLLELHTSKQTIFEKYGIEDEIEELFERQVKLPSGGYLVIDQAEALVAIDVNSGRSTKEADHEATVYKTNLEAAREVARQLRLRDMGGIIVVDFIDMTNRKHDREVERALRDAMKDDKARVKVGRISENGTLEITRQRLRQAHRLVSHSPCPHCEGTGLVRDPRGLAVRALRDLHNRVARNANQLARLAIRLPVDVANILQNTKRRELLELGDEHQILIDVVADARLVGNEIKYDEERRGKAGLDAAQGVRDPRLSDRGRRNGRRGRRDEMSLGMGGPTVPPLSIGPVPVFLHDEATIAEADARDAAAEAERERLAAERAAHGDFDDGEGEPAGREPRREPRRDDDRPPPRAPAERPGDHPAHYDDPLSEALFGKAPEGKTLADVEAAAPVEVAAVAGEPGGGEGGRKRRRRRRRKKKVPGLPGAEGDLAAAGADGAAEGDEGDEAEDETEADGGDERSTPPTALEAEEDAAWAAFRARQDAEAAAAPPVVGLTAASSAAAAMAAAAAPAPAVEPAVAPAPAGAPAPSTSPGTPEEVGVDDPADDDGAPARGRRRGGRGRRGGRRGAAQTSAEASPTASTEGVAEGGPTPEG
ncbi:MAG: Rne/Rng family ribonuclease [Deltaproteobacteria bacterium]|nr:Rne/Rng family ribonuclease [Deltaproteobacteria bacterium]